MTTHPENKRTRGKNPGGWTDREGVDWTEQDRREDDPQARGERRDERASTDDSGGEQGQGREEREEPPLKKGDTKPEKPSSE